MKQIAIVASGREYLDKMGEPPDKEEILKYLDGQTDLFKNNPDGTIFRVRLHSNHPDIQVHDLERVSLFEMTADRAFADADFGAFLTGLTFVDLDIDQMATTAVTEAIESFEAAEPKDRDSRRQAGKSKLHMLDTPGIEGIFAMYCEVEQYVVQPTRSVRLQMTIFYLFLEDDSELDIYSVTRNQWQPPRTSAPSGQD